MRTALVSAAAILAAASPSHAAAQGPDWTLSGSTYLANLGYSIDVAGDIDGDGAEDLLVGSPKSLGAFGRIGEVRILSGRTGEVLRTMGGISRYWPISTAGASRNRRQPFGSIVRNVGDVDGDGFDDHAANEPRDVGAPLFLHAGRVHVYSGATGTKILTLEGRDRVGTFGVTLDGAGDWNGDGFADIAVGDPTYSNGLQSRGAAYVFSGSDGSVLFETTGSAAYEFVGLRVAGLGDLDADGARDLAVHVSRPVSSNLSQSLRCYSAGSGTLIYDLSTDAMGAAISPSYYFARSLTRTDDLDGDGVDDFAIGDSRAFSSGASRGAVYLCSGADGHVFRTYVGSTNFSQLGWSLDARRDLDGDGVSDLLVSDMSHPPGQGLGYGRVYGYSGRDGSLLAEISGQGGVGYFGWDVAAGDFNGDGVVDVSASAPFANSPALDSGELYTYWR